MNLNVQIAQWRRLPARLRIVLVIAAFLVLAVALFAGILGQRPHVALFASALHPEQLSEVEERLAGWGVIFTPTADNVVVDAGQRNALLLRLSLAGVPHAHVTTSGETLAQIGALTPPSVIDAQTRSGLEGDLETGLRGIAGIDDAQVILAPAKAGAFADENAQPASASVRVHVHDGMRLAPSAVEGVRRFVAAGVPGLDPSHVTILDDSGVALGAENAAMSDAGVLQSSLQSALDQAFGAGATIVRVHAEADRHAETVHDVRRAPLGAVATSGTDESYSGEGKNYQRRERIEDRGSETRDVTTELAAGRTARVDAAIFVDRQRGLDLAKIRSLAAAAIGIDSARGDALSVEAVDFAETRVATKDGWWLAYGVAAPLLPTLAVVAGLLIALRTGGPAIGRAVRAAVDRLTIAQTKEAVRGFAPSQVAGALRNEPPHAAAAVISALPAATAAAVLDMYPAHERAAIVRRMQRAHSPLVPDLHEVFERA